MKKIFSIFAALTLCVGLWAETPAVGDTIIDANSGVYFAVTAVGETNTVKVIRNTAYSGNIIIPASVTSDMVTFTVNEIATTAFGNCKSLYSIDIPASVATIGANGFRTCSGLANIAVHWTESGKIPSIGSTVFQGIASGAKLHIPAGTKAIYNAASQWKTLSITEEQMPAVDEQFEDAASGLKFEICAMGAKLIANAYQATAYTIPTQVTYKSITYGVAVFASDAFQGCSQLADITVSWTDATQLPKNMTEALSVIGCATGTKLHVPTGKIEIYEAVEGLKEVVTIVEDYEIGDMFRDAASGLRFKVIALGTPDTVAVTNDMYSETSYTIPVSVTRGGHTFVVSEIESLGINPNLTALYFAEGSQVTKIDYGAFNNCSALTSLTIPACVIDITKAFKDNKALQTITFAEGSQRTAIQEEAFYNCSALQSVNLPANVTTIGKNAFYGCSALQSITIPASVTTIGEYAFENCSALQSVTFAEGSQLTTIGEYAFHSSGLTSIDLPAGVTEIEGVFYKCYHLTTVNFAEDAQIKEIGSFAFYHDTALTTITIPEDVTTIGVSAFDSCFALPSITIPASVTTIGYRAFAYCSNAQSITFAEGTQLQTIEYGAFEGCKSLPSITIPASVTKLEQFALGWCTQLASVTFEEGIQLTEFGWCVFQNDSALTSITIPASVTKLGCSVFLSCVQLASVTFEEGSKLTSIGCKCFENCPLLTSIDIPLTVTEIEYNAFLDCSTLADVTVHWTDAAQLPTLDVDVFKNIAAGAKLHVPAGTTAIYEAAEQWKDFTIVEESDPAKTSVITYTATEKLPETTDANTPGLHLNAFYAADSTLLTITHTFNEGVGTITLNGELAIIGDEAFYGTGITSVTLPASVTTIGEYAFSDTGLESINFGEGSQLTTIGYRAFNGSPLKSISIPASVTTIGGNAFQSCSSLQSVTLPASLKSIRSYTFHKCAALTSITLPSSLDSIGENAFAKSGLESITIPASVDTIGMGAFLTCTSLTSIVVEAGNTKYDSRDNCNGIVEKATNTLIAACKNTIIPNTVAILFIELFEALPITAITIPASVTTINNAAFLGCSSLAEVTVQWTTADAIPSDDNMGRSVFSGIADDAKLRVPTGTKTLYEAAEVWQDFTIIEEYTPTPTKTSVITYTATEKLPEATSQYGKGLRLNVFYAADSTQLTATHTFDQGVGTITLDGELAIIGDYAFYGTGITAVTLPEGVTTIGEFAFSECYHLSSAITIPASVTTIKYYAFAGCGIESITFAEGSQLTTIGQAAFNWCSLLKSIDIPASVKEIERGAFQSCSSLQSVTLPATLKSIKLYTFQKCAALTSITLPSSLDSIGEQAFAQSGLESITIPASVDSIAQWAFFACTSLTSIVVEAGNTKYDSRDNCNGIVEKATNTLIAACKNTIIPNTVAVLDTELFEMLPITAITIPASVTTIEGCAFMDCSSLAEVTVQWTTADAIPSGDNMASSAFRGIAAGAKLRVPTGTKALYEAAEVWQDFTIIEEYTPDPMVVRDTLDAVSACGSYVWEIYGKQLTLTESGFYNDTTIIEDSVITTLPLTIEPTTKTNYPAVQKYGSRLLVVDANAIHAEGWPFAEADVNWYKVAEPEDQLVKSGSYYYTADERFDGTYYALITISKEYDGCTEQLRTVDLVCPTAANQIVSMAPTMVTPRQTITLSHLDATSVSSVRVYSAQGQLLDAFSVEQSEFDFQAAEGSGCYLVIVENGKQQETFKYIVK